MACAVAIIRLDNFALRSKFICVIVGRCTFFSLALALCTLTNFRVNISLSLSLLYYRKQRCVCVCVCGLEQNALH